jgi:ketose-bisphosphate aldolase
VEFIPSIELVRKAEAGGYAVPSFCIWNAESIKTVLDCAVEMKAPVMIMNGWAEFLLLNPEITGMIARGLAEKHPYPIALHLDHGNSIEQIKEGLKAGYSSVMLDYSTKPFEENVQGLQAVAALAGPLGVTVEGELGAIGRADTETLEGGAGSSLTDPEDAAAYVEETGVDMLAVSIGNAHGIYVSLPKLDFERLASIRKVVRVPLVLHGGSGTPEHDLKRAISCGIAKVNVASEYVHAVRHSLTRQWGEGKNHYTPFALAEAMKESAAVVRKWIRMTGAEGRGVW